MKNPHNNKTDEDIGSHIMKLWTIGTDENTPYKHPTPSTEPSEDKSATETSSPLVPLLFYAS